MRFNEHCKNLEYYLCWVKKNKIQLAVDSISTSLDHFTLVKKIILTDMENYKLKRTIFKVGKIQKIFFPFEISIKRERE